MFHWCPEETAAALAAAGAVKVSWTHRRAIWAAVKAKVKGVVAWVVAKTTKHESHCCDPRHSLDVDRLAEAFGGRALAQQKVTMPERVLSKEEVAESFEKAKTWEGVMVTLKGTDGYALGSTSKES